MVILKKLTIAAVETLVVSNSHCRKRTKGMRIRHQSKHESNERCTEAPPVCYRLQQQTLRSRHNSCRILFIEKCFAWGFPTSAKWTFRTSAPPLHHPSVSNKNSMDRYAK